MTPSTPAAPASHAPTSADVAAAADRIAGYARHTPILRAHLNGRPLLLKLEHLQLTGAFKLRGALNALMAGPPTDHIITASGGNHGLGVATAARLLGRQATVYLPETTPEAKTRRLARTGAELISVGQHYAHAADTAQQRARTDGLHYLHAYDDAQVIAGQGTLGREIAAQAPDCDSIVVAVGGGGLAAGVRLGADPATTVVAAEPRGCPTLHAALAAGAPVETSVDSVASSALGASRLGTLPYTVISHHPIHPTLVDDDQIVAARQRLWEEFRLAVEPAAAVPLAAWLAGAVPGALPCLVICGANADWTPHEG
ncbi:serine/threonine dehydratase [Salinactinospora qingdaonensis]|uniref:Threonine/serine dehydratase n=1 Tax=Salinactinospora qingdaonensis TaxID=702744 RepID=A0ABP7G535_9ACTN